MVISGKYQVPGTDVSFPYFLTTPDGREAPASCKPLPMIVFLHGSGERGDDTELLKVYAIPKHFAVMGDKRECITLSPQCPKQRTWGEFLCELKALIEHIASEYNADPDRISCTGLSMGGFGTWELATRFPKLFCAIAPLCGGGTEWLAELIRDVPVWAFHGELDTAVPVTRTKDMIKFLQNAGGKPKMSIYPDLGHNCWNRAYDEEPLIDWLISAKKG